MAERIKLGGLWINKSKDGVEYLTGKLSPTVKILIFKNNFKTGDNQPSHIMYLAPVDPDPNAQREQNAGSDSFFGGGVGVDLGDFGGEPEEEYVETAPAPVQRPTQQQRPVAPASRPSAPAPQPPTRTMNAATTNTRPAQSAPQQRRPAPPPPADDINDFDDPFAE